MAVDLALDQTTHDLIASPSNDVTLVSGLAEVGQRIRTHLRIQLGSYELEPELGSKMNGLLRLPVNIAVAQVPLVVKEALAQMTDILVQDVTAEVDEQDPRKVNFTVVYAVTDDAASGDAITFNDSIEVVV